ncbi:MAG: MFS transporter [Proteobacteria bacterium]|nr:MFS transporter [Pseudomonadota bacterium]
MTAAYVAQAVAIGSTLSAYGLFIAPIEADLGATRAQTNFGITILMVVAAGIGPLLGRAIDRGPARAIMLGGVLLTAAGLAALSQATSLVGLALVLGLMVGVGHAAFGPLPAMTLLANWFHARRGTAIGIAATGTTSAGFVMPPLVAFLISSYGWRVTLLCIAAGCVAVAAPVIGKWVVKRPEEIGQFPDGRERPAPVFEPQAPASKAASSQLLRDSRFWRMAAVFGLMPGASLALIANLVPYAADLGIPYARAAVIMSCFALFTSLGKVLFGLLVDRIDMRAALWLSLGLQATAWLGMLSGPGFWGFLAAAVLFGTGAGAVMPIQGAMLGAAFGRAMFGRAMGLMSPLTLVPLALSPPLVGWFYDRTGSYTAPLSGFLAFFALAALLTGSLRIPRAGSLTPPQDAPADP